jgi:hypothetical protein
MTCRLRLGVGILICAVLMAQAQQEKPVRKGGSRQPIHDSKCNDVRAYPFDFILGRPTANSVTVSVLCYSDTQGFIAFGTQKGVLASKTPARLFKGGEPSEILLSGLKPNTQYFYQFRSAATNSQGFSFHTARPPGSTFTFTITADSHLDEHTDPVLYQRTLAGVSIEAPDFHIDLGDTFMTEKHANREAAARQYLAQRYYFGQLCESVPLFLVLGNHDGESLRGRGPNGSGLAAWSNTMRKRYFPNPIPDDFFTGNARPHPEAGLLQDYYAWEWGDALFIVLDPFWFTPKQRGQADNWNRTLGVEQYEWLKRTLQSSQARFRFIFVHHLVGGRDSQCRGGIEAAGFYEWGGKNPDGTDGFKEHRAGWPMPIHQLLFQNKVNVVFHGHDHFYARQELDGIVYQEVPQPGFPGDDKVPRSAAEYGYKSGELQPSSGFLSTAVFPDNVRIDYFRVTAGNTHLISDSYQIAPK